MAWVTARKHQHASGPAVPVVKMDDSSPVQVDGITRYRFVAAGMDVQGLQSIFQ
jgi:hypothetical protein